MKFKIIFSLALLVSATAVGQELSSYYSFILNPSNVNSALVGNGDDVHIILNSRSQLTGISTSPNNIVLMANAPLNLNQGVGLRVVNDKRGVFEVTRADARYSQRFEVNNDSYFRFGLSAGILSRNIDMGNINTDDGDFDAGDPVINSSDNNSVNLVAGFGALYQYKGLQLGLSAPHIIESSSVLNQYIVGSASYKVKFGTSPWSVEPTVYFQNIPVTTNIVDIFARTNWNDKASLILGYGSNNRIKAGAGFNIQNFGLSYMYESSTGELKEVATNTHELMLTVGIKRTAKTKEAIKMEQQLDDMLNHIDELLGSDEVNDKAKLKAELKQLNEELDAILNENSEKNAEQVADKLQAVEEKIELLLSKYNQ